MQYSDFQLQWDLEYLPASQFTPFALWLESGKCKYSIAEHLFSHSPVYKDTVGSQFIVSCIPEKLLVN